MFEKEAEEFKRLHTYYEVAKREDGSDYAKSVINVTIQEAFQKGAEFGYNKANEWHKQEVDDIYDLLSEEWRVRYFLCIMNDKSRVTAIGNYYEECNGGVGISLYFDHDDEKYCVDNIVWWKEIVLPI